MTSTRQNGASSSTQLHYRLTNEEWLRATRELKPREKDVLYYLRTLDPWGARDLNIKVTEIADALGCAKGTVSKALKALDSKKWIELEIETATVKLHSKHSNSVLEFPEGNGFPTGNQVSYRSQEFPGENESFLEETSVTCRKPLASETHSQQESQIPLNSLNSLNSLNYTNTEVCESKNNFSESELVQKDTSDSDEYSTQELEASQSLKTDFENEATVSKKDQYSAPPILAATKKYGVNVDDPKLREAIEKFPERVERAIQCLDEKQLTVKSPTRFLCAAIEQDWRPEKNVAPNEFSTWMNEAQKRELVVASQQIDGIIQVLTKEGQWMPYETLRRMDWDELQSQLNPAPEFVSETIKSISTHPDHGKVLEVPAVAVAPSSPKPSGDRPPSPRPKSPQDIAAKIKALGEAKSCP